MIFYSLVMLVTAFVMPDTAGRDLTTSEDAA